MPYPDTPFGDKFHTEYLWELGEDQQTNVNEVQNEITKWLCRPPEITTFRINTIKADAGDVLTCIETHVGGNGITIKKYPYFNDVILVRHPRRAANQKLQIYEKEVVIDTICAAAVLRGAHIYAPGVMAMMTGTQKGDHVSIYADLERKCKKGLAKPYQGTKIFIANGLIKMERYQLFCENPQTGIAVQITESISNCPPALGDNFIPPDVAILQNLPSIICVHVLAPDPQDTILDMCASPGNKTTHIAALTRNKAKLVAIDKTPRKVAQLKERCALFGANLEIVQADSTKLLEEGRFGAETFDKILLDAPCSALGQRPQLANTITRKVMRSYVPLQRRLFESAVKLLKRGGTLVYSTCTVTLGENEGIVAWALKNFNVELVTVTPMLGGPGLSGTNLTDDQLKKVQRFGPNQEIDSVGFFIAKFVKRI